jgi:hypothetical protein
MSIIFNVHSDRALNIHTTKIVMIDAKIRSKPTLN